LPSAQLENPCTDQQPIGRSRGQALLLAVAVILLNAVGNLSLTWGLRHVAETMGLNPVGYIRAMVNPFVAGGIGLLILWLLTRMALMSWADLTFVLPVTSIGYVLVAFLGHFILHEAVSPQHWVGTFFIVIGAMLVGATTHQSGNQSEEVPE
jgi:uncharacterized membrane protein